MSFQSAIVEQSYMTWLYNSTWENWSNFCNIQQWVQRWIDERAAREQAAREQAMREQVAHEQALVHEQILRLINERAARDQVIREQGMREQVAHEQALAREQAMREQVAHEQAIREHAMQSRLPPRSPPRLLVKSQPVLPLMLRPCVRQRSHLGNGVSFGTPSIW